MKFRQILILLFLCKLHCSFAGGWLCYQCKVEVITDSDTITGYSSVGEDFLYIYNTDFQRYFRERYNKPDEIFTLSDTVFSLNFPRVDKYKYTAIPRSKIHRLPVNSIRSIKLLGYGPCQEWRDGRDSTRYSRYYAWVGHTMPILELNMEEIDLLKTEPSFSKFLPDPLSEYGSYCLISYNDSLDQAEVIGIFQEYEARLLNYSGRLRKDLYYKFEYFKLKFNLRGLKVIIFTIGYAA